MKKGKIDFIKYFFIIIITCEVLFIIYFLSPLLFKTPSILLEIKSDSMFPELEVGDRVIINGRNKDFDDLTGEVIAFYDPIRGKIIVHRVIKKEENCLVTRGDNSGTNDEFCPPIEYVLGKVLFSF